MRNNHVLETEDLALLSPLDDAGLRMSDIPYGREDQGGVPNRGLKMYRAHTVSIAVAVSPESAYAYTSDPGNLPAWAPGFIKSIERRGEAWIAQSTLGEVSFRFAPPNSFGILDHEVELPAGSFHNPMRVIPNGVGCEILFTLLQRPDQSDAEYQTDLETIRGDLAALRKALEARYEVTTSVRPRES